MLPVHAMDSCSIGDCFFGRGDWGIAVVVRDGFGKV